MKKTTGIFAALLLLATSSFVAADEVRDEINNLIQVVADSGCVFIRNGDEHDSANAADHLKLKLRRGKRYASSTEKFIDRLASESSWSGDPYFIVCNDVRRTANNWLHAALNDLREKPR